MRKRLTAALLMLALLMLPGCGQKEEPPVESPPPPPPMEIAPEPESPPEVIPIPEIEPDPIGELIASMTLAEKVGQLFFVRVPAENAVEDVGAYHLGGYILFGRDTQDKTANDLIQTIAAYQEAADIPLLIGVDEEGGTVVRVSSNPHLRAKKFPSPQALWEAGNHEGAIFSADAREKSLLLQALGFNVNLAPVCDVSTDPGDFIYDRTLGQDAITTAYYVATVVDTMEESGMGSVLKHFPGYGNNVDTHTGIALDARPYEQFLNEDFEPFRAGIAEGEGTSAVLMSHNIVTCMDDTLPASLSPAVHDILREELDFEGVIMTDDLAMDAVSAYAEDGAVAVMAIEAGNDLILTTDYRTQIPKVIEAVESGRLSEETIDTACRRVLEWKTALSLIN